VVVFAFYSHCLPVTRFVKEITMQAPDLISPQAKCGTISGIPEDVRVTLITTIVTSVVELL